MSLDVCSAFGLWNKAIKKIKDGLDGAYLRN